MNPPPPQTGGFVSVSVLHNVASIMAHIEQSNEMVNAGHK